MILLPVPERGYHAAFWTGTLVTLNVVLFLISWPIEQRRAGNVRRVEWRDAAIELQTVAQADAATLPADLQQALQEKPETESFPSGALLQAFQKIESSPLSLSSARRYQWEQLYPRFSAMTASVASAREGSSPFRTFGFMPKEGWLPGVLTHQFLHAGWLHLIGNMVFLWVIGFVLEYAVGAWIIAFYLIGGIAAAWAQVHFGPSTMDAMVGASGAISSLMGFALGAIPSARVKLMYAVGGKGGFFHAPLWFFIPLWIIDQILQASLASVQGTTRVGYAAHLGGLAFGFALALLLRVAFQQKFNTPENPGAAW